MKSAVAFAGKSYTVDGDKVTVTKSGPRMENTSIEVQGEGGNLILPTELVEKILGKMPKKRERNTRPPSVHGWDVFIYTDRTRGVRSSVWQQGIQRLAVYVHNNIPYLLCELNGFPPTYNAIHLFNFLSSGGGIEPATIVNGYATQKGWIMGGATRGRDRGLVTQTIINAGRGEGHTYYGTTTSLNRLGAGFPRNILVDPGTALLPNGQQMHVVGESGLLNEAGTRLHDLDVDCSSYARDYGYPVVADQAMPSDYVLEYDPDFSDDDDDDDEQAHDEEEEGDA